MKYKVIIALVLCVTMLFTFVGGSFAQTASIQQSNGDVKVVKKLHLSQTDKMFGGVCGGLGEYFNVDPFWFRVAFAVSALVGGTGLVIYLVMWWLMPVGE